MPFLTKLVVLEKSVYQNAFLSFENRPNHPFSANRDHHQFKKTKNKVLPIVLSVNFSSRIITSLLFS